MKRLDFKSLVENTQDIIYLLDADGRIAYVNPVVERISGYRIDELIGHPFHDFIGPGSKAIAAERFDMRIREEQTHAKYVIELMTKKGELRTCEIHAHLFTDDDGKPWVQGTITDITDHLMLRRAAEAEKRRFERLVESASSMIIGMDLQGSVILFNRGSEAILGYRKEEVLGRSAFGLLFPPEERQDFIDYSTKAQRKDIFGEIVNRLTPFTTRDGNRISVAWTVNTLTDENDDVIGFLGIGQDITEMVNLEEELKDRNRILEALNQLDLIASISFDPKIMISAALEMMVKFFGFTKGLAFLVNDINGRVERIAGINVENPNLDVNDLSSFPEDFREIVISNGKAVFIKEGSKDPRLAGLIPDIGSALFQPLRGHTNTVGAILMYSDETVDMGPNDLTTLETASILLGYPLENSQLYESLKRSSSIVELYNDIILHDMENYLIPVASYVTLAGESVGMPDVLMRYLRKADASLVKMENSLSDFRLLIKTIEEQDARLESTNLLERLEDAIEITKERFGNAEIVVEPESVQALSTVNVSANKALTHLYMNLLTNAVKHGAPNCVKVSGSVDEKVGTCRVEIEDKGLGVSDENKLRVFERRYSSASVRAPKSSGLGLTIVKTLTDRYHGRVWVEDRVDGDHTKGARFVVELPILTAKGI